MKKCRHPVVHAFLWRKWEEKAFKIGRELRKNLVFTWLLIWLVLNKFTHYSNLDPRSADWKCYNQGWWSEENACVWKDPGRVHKFHIFFCFVILLFVLR